MDLCWDWCFELWAVGLTTSVISLDPNLCRKRQREKNLHGCGLELFCGVGCGGEFGLIWTILTRLSPCRPLYKLLIQLNRIEMVEDV